MVQSAKPWHGDNFAVLVRTCHRLTPCRSLLAQAEMRSVAVIVADVLVHQAFQMAFVQNDHMVEQIPAAVSDPSFGHAVLPGTSEAGALGLDAEALNGLDHLCIETGATVEDQILRCGIVRKGLPQLLRHPRAGRMAGHIAVKDATPVMRDDKETVENTESERGHGKEIHRRDGFTVVVEKCRPSLCRLGISGSLPHPAQHGSLRDVEPQHFDLTMNARRAPCGVLGN